MLFSLYGIKDFRRGRLGERMKMKAKLSVYVLVLILICDQVQISV